MAEPEKEKQADLSIPMPWGGKVTANGFDVVFLIGFVILGVMMYKQNDLLHDQTAILRQELDKINCNLGIDIFSHQFEKGKVDWDLLPVQLYRCRPDYAEKMPRKEMR